MRIKMKDLERLIIREMTWNSLGTKRREEEYYNNKIPGMTSKGMKKAESFANSKGFSIIASKLFGNFPYDVWTGQILGKVSELKVEGSSPISDTGRCTVYDLSKSGDKIFRSLGYSQDKISKINPEEDLVILYGSFVKPIQQYAPTPWIIIHSMLDPFIFPSYYDEMYAYDQELAEKYQNYHTDYGDLFTFGSIRKKGHIYDFSDYHDEAIHEIFTQAILNKRGILYNREKFFSLEEDEQYALKEFREKMHMLAGRFIRNLKGKIVLTDINDDESEEIYGEE